MPRPEPQRPSSPSDRPEGARQPARPKDDPHLAPESGDKPDAATPDDDDTLAERGAPT